jgi:hypothetical protein
VWVGALSEIVQPKRGRLNAEEKRRLTAADLQLFAKQYARPAPKGREPNDRRYSRATERLAKQLRPADLDELLRGDE